MTGLSIKMLQPPSVLVIVLRALSGSASLLQLSLLPYSLTLSILRTLAHVHTPLLLLEGINIILIILRACLPQD